jgi:acyl-CoA thioester hydrolase
MGCNWLIRETEIEYMQPLQYGDTVAVKTWVKDFRRVRSRRAYEFVLSGTGAIIARGATDWVFMDTIRQRPATIPPELMTAFFPEGPPRSAPSRQRFPKPPLPPPGVFHHTRRVEWRDLDEIQHVNNATYLAYLEDAGIQALAAFGWPLTRLASEGLRVIARRHRIEYKQPAVLDDELLISIWHADASNGNAVRHCTIHRSSDEALVAQASTELTLVNTETGCPVSTPADFRADIAPNVSAGTQRGME